MLVHLNNKMLYFLIISILREKSVGTTEPHYNTKERHHVLEGGATIKFGNTVTYGNELLFPKLEFKET